MQRSFAAAPVTGCGLFFLASAPISWSALKNPVGARFAWQLIADRDFGQSLEPVSCQVRSLAEIARREGITKRCVERLARFAASASDQIVVVNERTALLRRCWRPSA